MVKGFSQEAARDLGRWLKGKRLERKISTSKVAKAVNMSVSHYVRLEKGEAPVPLQVLARLHRELRYEPEELIRILLQAQKKTAR